MASPRRTVGRPRSFDEETVLDNAVGLFWRDGATKTTTRVLEAELELTPSSIYNAFGSKRDLLEQAVERYLDQIDGAVVGPLEVPNADVSSLLRFVDDLHAWISHEDHPGCLLLNLLAEHGTADAGIVERARTYRDRLRGAVRASLDKLDPATAPVRTELVLAGVLGLNIAARGGADAVELDALAAGLRNQIQVWNDTARAVA